VYGTKAKERHPAHPELTAVAGQKGANRTILIAWLLLLIFTACSCLLFLVLHIVTLVDHYAVELYPIEDKK
jgi:hypothetical protein